MAISPLIIAAALKILTPGIDAMSGNASLDWAHDRLERAARADEECNNRPEVKDGYLEAIIECAGEDSERLDAIVEEVYQRSRRLLPPAERQKLVRSQRIWRATREKRCTPKGKIAMFEVWQIYNCLALKSIDRIEWLDRRIGTASNSRRD